MDARPSLQNQAFTALSFAEAATLDAFFEQLFPVHESGPGASSIGVIHYLDRALSGQLHLGPRTSWWAKSHETEP